MLSLFPDLFAFQNFAPLILRLVLGFIFIIHGYPKLFKDNSDPGIFWAYLAGAVEFFGGIFLVLGLFTQLAAAALTLEILVSIVKMKFSKGFAGGHELDLTLLAMALALVLLGPGALSLDLPL